MTTWKSWGSAFGIVIVLACLNGCAAKDTRAAVAARQGVLLFGNQDEPQSLDPHAVTGMTEHRILFALFEGLASLDFATMKPIPAAAESWTVSSDQLVYTFKIRANAKWSNGDPLLARDFVFAFQRILTPKFAAEYSDMLYCMKNAQAFHDGKLTDFSQVGVKAIDDRTLEITLEHPTPYFLSMQTHYTWFPVHKATLEKFGPTDERGTPWDHAGNMVCNGPYRLETWEPNRIIRVIKNEQYWGVDSLRLSAIEYYPIQNESTEEHSFRSGELHLTQSVPVSKIEVYQRENPELIHFDPFFCTYYYRFNINKKPLDDIRVRRALSMAIDRKAIVEKVTKGRQEPAGSLVPPNSTPADLPAYTCPVSVKYDVDQARKLLADAGYPNGQGVPPIQILYNTAEGHRQIAEAIQNMWKVSLNVDATLTNQDWKVYLDSMSKLDFHAARSSWIGDYLDPFSFLDCFVTNRGNNRTGFSSPEYDALLQESTQTADPVERIKLLERAEGILIDAAPIAPIYYYKRIYLQTPALKGYQPNLLGIIDFKTMYFEPQGQ